MDDQFKDIPDTHKRYMERRKLSGLCLRAGCKRVGRPGRTECTECAAESNKRAKAYYHKQKAKSDGSNNHT